MAIEQKCLHSAIHLTELEKAPFLNFSKFAKLECHFQLFIREFLTRRMDFDCNHMMLQCFSDLCNISNTNIECNRWINWVLYSHVRIFAWKVSPMSNEMPCFNFTDILETFAWSKSLWLFHFLLFFCGQK